MNEIASASMLRLCQCFLSICNVHFVSMIAAESNFVFRNMAEASDLLEWPKKDNRRFLHVVYRVGDLDRTIEYVFFVISFINHFSVTGVIYILRYSFFFSHQVLH